jgi:4-hydroxy-tetrahydrodipicolinate reductase
MKLALIGYGKMGQAIEKIALEKGHEITLKISSKNKEELTIDNLKKADVAVEFTNPDSAVRNIELCFEAGVPVISGSTGWLERFDEVKEKCLNQNGSFLYASNFSVGVNIFFEINKRLAELMNKQNYNVHIEETHHTEKKDAPSGTAITLANDIIERIDRKTKWVKSEMSDVKSEKDGLVIFSKRIDPAPGTHLVKYSSEVDDIEIVHTAHNRMGFAQGAVLAAEFIRDKKGVFSMKDVLDL